jgi:predicted AAA+ superfamily ATPase
MPMKISLLEQVAKDQKVGLDLEDFGLARAALDSLPDLRSHALIISGIRRCGKSTLLRQFLKKHHHDAFYFNFEDIRLYDFRVMDFALLDAVIATTKLKTLFFDEIQVVEGWELFVRQKLDQGFKVVITGSNASLLSRELGTKLTGRHITKELFPFSYGEFLSFKKGKATAESLRDYLQIGGFPETVKTDNVEMLGYLADDILNRDIIVRYGIRDAASLKRLFSYLLSNAAKLTTPSKLKESIGIKSPSTILDYFSHLEACYLIHMVPRFAYSVKARMLAPKKMYVVDTGLIRAGSASFSNDNGRLLENAVFGELRRRGKEIFYFAENNSECDFVEMEKGRLKRPLQVCWELTGDNEEREIAGLVEALKFFKHDTGAIITAAQRDTIRYGDYTINVIPAHEFLTQ